MATKTSTEKDKITKRKPATKEPTVKPSDWLNFSSAIAVVLATSIFFTSGWVYVATWFSFYGLNANDLQIPTQMVLINGIPGVFAAIFVGFLSFSVYVAERHFSKDKLNSSVRQIFLIALTAEGAILTLFLLIGLLVGLSIGWDYNYLWKAGLPSIFELRSTTTLAISLIIYSILAFAITIFILGLLAQSEKKKGEAKESRILKAITQFVIKIFKLPNVWTGFILLLYFVIAMVISYFLGEIDASRGGQLMSSNWKIPVAYLHSEKEVPQIEYFRYPASNPNTYIYGPFSLLFENSNGYYFSTIKNGSFYTKSPVIYFLPKEISSAFWIEIQPRNDSIIWSKNPTSQPQGIP
ncbi:MAG: hypothetical protein U0Z26_12365 [Anaerolineales bacterium]